MQSLREQYLAMGKRNHGHDIPEGERRVAETRVHGFLEHCGARGVRRLEDIRQEHYASFIRSLGSRGRSAWTIYKYQLAIRRMAMRRRLRIKINACLPRQQENRRKMILGALDNVSGLTTDQRRWILKALDGVI